MLPGCMVDCGLFCESVNPLNHNFQNDIHGDQPALLVFIVCLSGLTSGKQLI